MTAALLTTGPRRFIGFSERVEDYAAAVDGDCEVFGFTGGDFSVIDVIDVVRRRLGPAELIVATWTAAGAEMGHVHDWLAAGGISAARWIVDRSFQNRQPELCAQLRARFGDEANRVQRVHCKFALLRAGQERGVVIQTSANLNRNRRIENVAVSACPVLFGAYQELVRRVFDTQLPGAGFESDSVVSEAFRRVTAGRHARRRTVVAPW